MVWLAKNDLSMSALCGPNRAPSATFTPFATPACQFLDCGSLVIETTCDHTNDTPPPLLHCANAGETNSRFLLTMDKDGTIKIRLQTGDTVSQLEIAKTTTKTLTQLRITFSWDLRNKTALLSVESPEQGSLCQAESNSPLPMPMEIIDALLAQKPPASVSANITFMGVSDQIEPVGFTPSIAQNTLIDTPIGSMPIEELLRGDLVTTQDNGPQPVRWICERTVPTRGLFQPLRLRAPFFGLTQDVLVAPEQRLVFEDTEIEYMFGVESVLVEARHLVNNVNVIREPARSDTIRLYQLLFDNHEIITVAGCQMESLFIGQIAEHPEMLKSTLLAGLATSDVPCHKEIARPLLRSYEAMALQCGVFH
ncbi:Hint domain-containing protein [Profundibacter sp.]